MKPISILLYFLLSFTCFTATSQIVYLKGILDATQEVPANASPATGVAIVKYNMATKVLELTGSYTALSDSITGAHIHRGVVGASGSIIISLDRTGITAGELKVTETLTQNFEDLLLAGNTYVNVHSKQKPGGEIRAQLTVATQGNTAMFTGRLQGAQEAPPNGSAASGTVAALLDNTTREIFVTGTFRGLALKATAAHIHRGPIGLAGPFIVTLSATSDTIGSISGYGTVSAAFADSYDAGK